MGILAQARVMRSLRKTPVIVDALLRDVSQARAEASREGDWNVVSMVCHMRDHEAVIAERARLVLEHDNPLLPMMNNKALIGERDDAHQRLMDGVADMKTRRRALLAMLSGLNDAQWLRRGVHSEFGEGTLLDVMANAVMHDIDHTEQIARSLGLAERLD